MEITILAAFIGGVFAIIVALVALFPYIKQWMEERKDAERQRIRDLEEVPYFCEVVSQEDADLQRAEDLSSRSQEEAKAKHWWQFWR